MTDLALIALLDTLLPGDDGLPPLPAFSRAGIDPATIESAARRLLAELDQRAFVQGTAADRTAMVRTLERGVPEAFRILLGEALAAYYQAPRVQAVLGWRSEPPQPAGHRLEAGDDVVWRLLEPVRRRGRLWRG